MRDNKELWDEIAELRAARNAAEQRAESAEALVAQLTKERDAAQITVGRLEEAIGHITDYAHDADAVVQIAHITLAARKDAPERKGE